MAEWLLYLPSIGVVACIVLGVYEIGRRLNSRALAPIVLGIFVAVLAARTLVRNQDWSTALAMDESGVRNSPDSFKTHDAFGSRMFDSDSSFSNTEKVIEETRKSIAILDP